MLNIKFEHDLQIAGKPVSGAITLHPTGLHLVLGSNGVGKTSLFRHLLDHQQNYGLDGIASFAPQNKLAPVNSMKVSQVFEQLYDAYPSRVKCDPAKFELIEAFGAKKLWNKEVAHLSGGENQIIKLLLAFYLKATYYFLDEPFQFLDSTKFQVLLNFIVGHPTSAMVVIDHRNPELLSKANYIYELTERNGAISLGENS